MAEVHHRRIVRYSCGKRAALARCRARVSGSFVPRLIAGIAIVLVWESWCAPSLPLTSQSRARWCWRFRA